MFLDIFLFSVASSQAFSKLARCCQGDATTHAECWDESYSFEECCPNADCWDGDYFTYEACRGTWGINWPNRTCRCSSNSMSHIQAVIRSTGRTGMQAWISVTCGPMYSDPLRLRSNISPPNVFGEDEFPFPSFSIGIWARFLEGTGTKWWFQWPGFNWILMRAFDDLQLVHLCLVACCLFDFWHTLNPLTPKITEKRKKWKSASVWKEGKDTS